MSNSRVDIAAGAAHRRRLRSMLRHERMSLAMALADESHHTAPQGQRTARAGVWGHELNFSATIRDPSPPLPHTHQPGLFGLCEEEPGGTRPDRIATLSVPQERDLRRTVQQSVGAVPLVPFLEDPAPQMVEQVLQFFDALIPDPDQVIEVPKILRGFA